MQAAERKQRGRWTLVRGLGFLMVAGMLSGGARAAVVAPEKEDAGAVLEQGMATILALEDSGDFAGGIKLCNDLLSKFPSHPDLRKVREADQRLRREKREALPLHFAIETLDSDRAEGLGLARKQLQEAGDVGAILLRQVVRKGSGKAAVEAINILQELEDPKANQST
jgi:hypothetical protein